MSTCRRCGASYTCGVAAGQEGPCWCASLPAVLPVPGVDASCWCPACLQAQIRLQDSVDELKFPRAP